MTVPHMRSDIGVNEDINNTSMLRADGDLTWRVLKRLRAGSSTNRYV